MSLLQGHLLRATHQLCCRGVHKQPASVQPVPKSTVQVKAAKHANGDHCQL